MAAKKTEEIDMDRAPTFAELLGAGLMNLAALALLGAIIGWSAGMICG